MVCLGSRLDDHAFDPVEGESQSSGTLIAEPEVRDFAGEAQGSWLPILR